MRVSVPEPANCGDDVAPPVCCAGDKEETAINIGRSCKLLHNSMKVIVLNAEDEDAFTQQLAMARAELRNADSWYPDTVNENLGLVIQGHSLAHVLNYIQGKPQQKERQRFSLAGIFGTTMPAVMVPAFLRSVFACVCWGGGACARDALFTVCVDVGCPPPLVLSRLGRRGRRESESK